MSTPKSGQTVPLQLDPLDLGQTLDALDSRAAAYEKTAAYLDGDGEAGWDIDAEDGGLFVIEEVRDADEARAIASHFRAIEASLQAQWDAWRAGPRKGDAG
ncbi:hypothetical protein IT575_01035 [bacterium]|nr:hypothetical protein [bacterium]